MFKIPQALLKLEEPFRLHSILEFGPPGVFTTLTKTVGILGPNSRSVEVLEKLLKAGMSVARFDFTWGDDSFHQETLDNLKIAVKITKRLCAIMLDSIGPELKILNESGESIEFKGGSTVVLIPDKSKVALLDFLPINYSDLSYHVKSGDEIFVGQYLYTESETTFVWLQVIDINGPTVNCLVKTLQH
jgi:pyruvate kinase